ncbi:MAG: cyclase family protein [Acidobacteriota bacterium]
MKHFVHAKSPVSIRAGVALVLTLVALVVGGRFTAAQDSKIKGWKEGKGWGWIWGKDDEVGALNAMTSETVLRALKLAAQGKVYDLGLTYDRTSYKWPGHAPAEILSFRTPEGVKRQLDHDFVRPEANKVALGWHSAAIFMSDNVATQIDGLSHITTGNDNHWYNGFKEADWGGNWGPRKADATKIPPIVNRAVLIDVAGFKKVDALNAATIVTVEDMKGALAAQKMDIQPGDAVFLRTGTLRYWGETGSDHEKIRAHDSAGIDLRSARWLVEEKGAILVGSDTSGLEVAPAAPDSTSFIPVHEYLLVEQGVHIGEFHYLEDLARDKVYEFCYVAATNKIKGTAAGFTLRPLAIR